MPELVLDASESLSIMEFSSLGRCRDRAWARRLDAS